VKVNTNLDLPILLDNRNDIGYPLRMLFLPDETGVYKLLLELSLSTLIVLEARKG